MHELTLLTLRSVFTQGSANGSPQWASLVILISMLAGLVATFGLLRLVFLQEQKKKRQAESQEEERSADSE
jgi:hypothetical protein